jgi:hypothetical protein
MSTKPFLVGELNTRTSSGDMALYPLPPNGSGGRLRRILGLGVEDYLTKFDRINLCSESWNDSEARELARKVRRPGRRLVLLGRRVARIFGLGGLEFFQRIEKDGVVFFLLPHPSGLCRVWNDPDSSVRARSLLTEGGVL